VSEWTTSYFDTLYLRRWRLGLPSADVRRNAQYLIRLLEAQSGRALLDVGCGQGRYAIAFAEQAMRVTGIDASEVLLAEARRLAARAGVSIDWRQLDMRWLPFGAEFDHAVLMDAFGFFDTPEEDRSVLAGIATALKPGGTAALIVVNGQFIRENFKVVGREGGEALPIDIERSLEAGNVMVERLTFREGGRVETRERRQRLYHRDELVAAATAAGLVVESLHGDFRETAFADAASEKMVLKARRFN
jgi:2-polyprenyl-3-methyl-5-hydroxy-6-metoxy-1,4-benzoquinol methylase